MKTFEDRLGEDILIHGKSITECVWMPSWEKRIWGAWQVLRGEAGVIIYRIDPKRVYKNKITI